jgi:glutamine amidotransferase
MPFYAYFAHSYAADVCSTENVVGNLILSERKIPAVIEKGNVFGVQFHPEKSGEVGLQIIKNFLSKSEDDGNY